MKQQTFEEYLQERFSSQYGDGDETSDDFDQWIAELDVNKCMEYAQRWGKESNSIYLINTLTNLIQNHDVR